MRVVTASLFAVAMTVAPALAMAADANSNFESPNAQANSAARAQPAPAHAQPTNASHPDGQVLDQQDQSFLKQAASDNQGEIQLGLLAETRAQHPSVKAFARLMIDDHAALQNTLAAVSEKNQVQLPIGPTQGDEQLHSQLENKSGAAFDRQFMSAQVQDHQNDVQKFTQERNRTRNEEVKQLAAQTIPVLEQHLRLAEAVQNFIQSGGRQVSENGSRP